MSSLRSRLDALRGPATPATPGVAERLQRLRSAAVTTRTQPDDAALAVQLGAAQLAPGVLRLEERFALSARHGSVTLGEVAAVPAMEALPEGPRLFVDTETTGLAGGTGTLVFLLGLLVVGEGEARLVQLLLTRFAGEPALLVAAREELAKIAGLVSYNGKSFDLPLLVARCRLARQPDPWSPLPHHDLLHPVRRAFASRWPDCRLQTAERRLLGFERQDDLPGAEAPQAWFDWVRRGDAGRLPGVVRHNRWDLLSLAGLLPAVAQVFEAPGSWGADVVAVARAKLDGDEGEAALKLLERHRGELDAAGLLLLARLQRARGRWEAAVALWEPLAAEGDPEALLQLAKYHEHQRRDFNAALGCTRRLLALEAGSTDHEHRAGRLLRRLKRDGIGANQEALI